MSNDTALTRLSGGYLALDHLKTWAELHQLDVEMIMDGIEHMMKSIEAQQNGEWPIERHWYAEEKVV